MLLALSVVSPQGAGMGAAAYKIFDARGGSIGRLDTNDWALPDPDRFVSSRHAVVRFADGAFCLEDVSTNGTFLNAPHLAVARGEPARLKDGDRLYIGDYEILVQLIDDGPGSPASAAPSVPAVSPGPAAPSDSESPRGPADRAPELFAALGLDARDVDPALAVELAGILRTAVQGIIDGLRSRAKRGPARVEDLGGDAAANLRLLFGEQFVKACHERLEKLAQSANFQEK